MNDKLDFNVVIVGMDGGLGMISFAAFNKFGRQVAFGVICEDMLSAFMLEGSLSDELIAERLASCLSGNQ